MRITGRRVSESTNVSNHLKAIPLHCQTSPYAPVVILSIPLGIHTCASQCYGLTSLPNSKHHLKNTQRYHQGKEKYLQFYPSPLKIHEECIWKSLNRSLFYFGRSFSSRPSKEGSTLDKFVGTGAGLSGFGTYSL